MTSPETALPRYLRLPDVLAPRGPLPISKSSWFAGIAAGRYPKPYRLGPRISAWRVDDIHALIASINRGEAGDE